MDYAVANAQKLADMCRTTESQLRSLSGAFEKLKAAIEAQGYVVVHHMHSDTYSVFKPSKQ